jgi:hypothetical protein
MTGEDEHFEASQLHGLAPIFTPVRAAEILRSLGLDDMTACALKTRAYRRQIPFHLNGHRIIFTEADLREIAEGQAHSPEPRAQPERPEPPARATSLPSRRRTAPRAQDAGREVWRARRPRDA